MIMFLLLHMEQSYDWQEGMSASIQLEKKKTSFDIKEGFSPSKWCNRVTSYTKNDIGSDLSAVPVVYDRRVVMHFWKQLNQRGGALLD